MKSTLLLTLSALALAAAPNTHAAVLFSNVGQTHVSTGATNARFSSAGDTWASDFQTSTQATTITGATFYMFNLDPEPHTYTATIYADAAGLPGAAVGSFDVYTVPGSLFSENSFVTSSSGITLSANTKYWMGLTVNEDFSFLPTFLSAAVQTDSQAVDAGSQFGVVTSTTSLAFKLGDDPSWLTSDQDRNLVFSLNSSAVPEPSRAILVGLGLAGLVLRRRRTAATA